MKVGTKIRMLSVDLDGIIEIINIKDAILKIEMDFMDYATCEWGKETGYFNGTERLQFLIDSGLAMVV